MGFVFCSFYHCIVVKVFFCFCDHSVQLCYFRFKNLPTRIFKCLIYYCFQCLVTKVSLHLICHPGFRCKACDAMWSKEVSEGYSPCNRKGRPTRTTHKPVGLAYLPHSGGYVSHGHLFAPHRIHAARIWSWPACEVSRDD